MQPPEEKKTIPARDLMEPFVRAVDIVASNHPDAGMLLNLFDRFLGNRRPEVLYIKDLRTANTPTHLPYTSPTDISWNRSTNAVTLTSSHLALEASTVAFVADTSPEAPRYLVKPHTSVPRHLQSDQLGISWTRLYNSGEAQQGTQKRMAHAAEQIEQTLQAIKDANVPVSEQQTKFLQDMHRTVQLTVLENLLIIYHTSYYDPYRRRRVPTITGEEYGQIVPTTHLALRIRELAFPYPQGTVVVESGITVSKMHGHLFTPFSEAGSRLILTKQEEKSPFATLIKGGETLYLQAERLLKEQQRAGR